MSDPRAYRCWIPGQEDLGNAFTLAVSADKARYGVALSAADTGYLPKPSPAFVRCCRCPEHDSNPSLSEGFCSSEDHLRLGTAVLAQSTP
jgi:hypothetical protein